MTMSLDGSLDGTVFLVDPDPATREQVAKIAERLGLAFQAHGVPETVPVAIAAVPQACVISEFVFEHGDGMALQMTLLESAPQVPLIYLIREPDTLKTVRAIRRGAVDVLDKSVDDTILTKVIRGAMRQRRRYVRTDPVHTTQICRLTMLSTAEQDVLAMIMQGKPNKVIARQLGVSMRTIELRRQRIFQKTNTRSLAQLLMFVLSEKELG